MCDEYDYVRVPAVADILGPSIVMQFFRRYEEFGGVMPVTVHYDICEMKYRFDSVFFRDEISERVMIDVFDSDDYESLRDRVENIALSAALSDPTCGVGA